MAESTAHTPATGELHFEAERLYGIIAEFEDAPHVLEAARRTYEAGYRRIDAYTPFPVEGLSDALGQRDFYVPWIMLAGGILGGAAGFGLLYFTTVIDYRLNIGGRPLFAWPSFIPITFEMVVLTSALAGIVGMFAISGLPMPYHPVFSAPNFDLATSSRFFLCIEAEDPHFDRVKTYEFMQGLGAAQVSEVELRK